MGHDFGKYELAYDDYLDGMKYKDITVKYGVTVSIVKPWKSCYWKDKKVQQKRKRLQPEKMQKRLLKNNRGK